MVRTELSLRYNAKRDRTEHVRFTLTAGQQAIVTEASGSDDIKTLTLKGADVGIALGDDPAPPIGDLSRRTFFPTEQGQQMIVYAINVARADLLTDSRVASASFDCRFRRALQLSCRMNAILHHPKVPGGVMVGKILKIVLSGEGSTGLFKGNVTIGAACGTGVALEAVAGDPTYVDADVLGADVQVFANRFVVLGTGDIGYPPPVDQANDDGLVFPLTYDQVVVRDEIKSGDVSQAAAISQAASPAGGDPTSATDLAQQGATQASAVSAAFANANVWYELELKPVDNGPFEDAFVFDVAMSLPKQLDLGAGG
ncbi:hypothetical protein [Bradyrhizobium sp. RDM4]|uniref:hypothetical protein n=1 Tax=Bradyrhizobium sp. RDM4 TaxID=3378765 RepID=UPI0038FCD757